jgi:hypothetical protein
LLESEIHVCHALLFLEHPLLGLGLSQESNVLKKDLDDFLVILEALVERSATQFTEAIVVKTNLFCQTHGTFKNCR